jgi:hypothetical protein
MNQGLAYEVAAVMPAAVNTDLMSSTVTFYMRPVQGDGEPTVDALGQPDNANADYTAITSLSGIVCQLSVLKPMRPDVTEITKTQIQTEDRPEFELLLSSYYPTVLAQYLANVDGTFYQVMAVESDSQQQVTRCALRTYTL